MELNKTHHGFDRVDHKVYEGYRDDETPRSRRLIQESSAIGSLHHQDDSRMPIPGSSFLWIGDFHHLDRKEVEQLIRYLQSWVAIGRIQSMPSIDIDGTSSQKES